MNLIKVDMSAGKIVKEPLPDNEIIGGRAIIDHLMINYANPTAHPFSEKSPFIAAAGILAGTGAPQAGRLSVGGKSPLTNGIKEANVGGTAAHKLARLDIAGIVVEGRSDNCRVLKVDHTGVTLEAAEDVKGLTTYAACDKLRARHGEKVGIIIIGPAGEMRLPNSTVAVTDPEGRPSRHAARGGIGAIMGAKGLKAIVIDDTHGSLRQAKDKDAFRAAAQAATEAIKNNGVTPALHEFGPPIWVDSCNASGSMPTYNHRAGAFEKFESINARKMIEIQKNRGGSMGHGCMPGCVVRCSPIYHDAQGNYLTAAFEYETLAMLGANLGIDDMDAIARMDRRCDELGIDTIELGCAIGVLNDVGRFEFGDAAKAESLIEEIAQGTPMGRILGSGVATTAKVYGIDRVPAVKGLGIPAHSARSMKGWGVTYATSPQGADHTAGAVGVEPHSPNDQGQRSLASQISMAAFDAIGMCWFTFIVDNTDVILPMINAFYGVDWDRSAYLAMGQKMLKQELDFNKRAGGVEADGLPDWMSEESLAPMNQVFDVPRDEIKDLFNF